MALTLVITGVILIMVAITVISFTGGSLGNLFGFAQSQNRGSQCQRAIRGWCAQSEQDLQSEISTAHFDHCDQNITGNDGDTLSDSVTLDDCRSDWTHSDAPNFTVADNYICSQPLTQVDADGHCPVPLQ